MSFNPRTPARHRAKSDAASKTPLTPSIISGISNINVSTPANKNTRPTKYAPPSTGGASNPFVSRPRATSTRGSSRPTSRPASRAASPVKRATSGGLQISESLQKQAGTGVVRKGGVESKLDVMSKGQAPPPRKEIKRSKSTPAGLRVSIGSVASSFNRTLLCRLYGRGFQNIRGHICWIPRDICARWVEATEASHLATFLP